MQNYDEKDFDSELKDNLKYIELQKMIEKADNAVLAATGVTGATGAIPIPFADAPLLVAEQVSLMASIAAIFKIDIKKDGLKTLAMVALGTGGATVIGKTIVTGIFKCVPGIGSVAGGAISAATAGSITFAMGKAFIEVCKAVKMGKFSESEITSSTGKNMLKNEFKKQFRKK